MYAYVKDTFLNYIKMFLNPTYSKWVKKSRWSSNSLI